MVDNSAVFIRDVNKFYGTKEILRKICMTVERGKIYGLLGASGCGKTTLLKVIVGTSKIDGGEIRVLGETPRGGNCAFPGPKVGYMPQDIALCGEFTVQDAVQYFGRLFGMNDNLILERYHNLHQLLELPPHDRYLRKCSGGEQRRVSLAATLIHKPELLILDEPTVGLDPVMRERIWNHLFKITRKEKTSVIITTHYVEECRGVDRVGLMRNGKLLAEESPKTLLDRYNTETLEQAFLILSKNDISSTNISSPIVKKNLQNGIFFLLSFPVLEMGAFLSSVGGDVKNIPIGIINDEVVDCSNFSSNETVLPYDYMSCHLYNMGCRFLSHLEDPMLSKVSYSNLDEAMVAAKRGEVAGIVYISKNFTHFFEKRFEDMLNENSQLLDLSQIKVWLDMSNYQIGNSMKIKLVQIYNDFQDNLLSECEIDIKYFHPPFRMNNFYVGSNKQEPFIVFMLPGILITVQFFLGAVMTSQIIITDRHDGVWERSIVAGVTSMEIMLSHFILQLAISVIQTFELMFCTFVLYQLEYFGSLWLMFLLVFSQGVCGMSFGFFVSVISTDHTMANVVLTGLYLPVNLLSGWMWPIEGMVYGLRVFSRCLPLTVAIESFRNVFKKGWHLNNIRVLDGLLIGMVWTIFLES